MFTLLTHREHVEEALRQVGRVYCWSEVPMDLGNIRPLIPLQVDPPKHVKYRRILDPLFAPKQMALLEDEVAELVNQLMDNFASTGRLRLPRGVRRAPALHGLPAPDGPAPRGPRPLPGR